MCVCVCVQVVIISENSSRPQSEFYYSNWLSQDVPEATLYSQSAMTKYHVLLAVSPDAGAAWDGQVRIHAYKHARTHTVTHARAHKWC